MLREPKKKKKHIHTMKRIVEMRVEKAERDKSMEEEEEEEDQEYE